MNGLALFVAALIEQASFTSRWYSDEDFERDRIRFAYLVRTEQAIAGWRWRP